MDTKQKIFFILFLFSLNFFSLTNIDLTEISKANEEEKVTKTKIFKDSLVFIDKENKLKPVENIKIIFLVENCNLLNYGQQ